MKLKLRHLLTFLLLVLALCLYAQPGGGGSPGGGGNEPCANPPCNSVPISGLEWIIGAGALLGASRLRQKKS